MEGCEVRTKISAQLPTTTWKLQTAASKILTLCTRVEQERSCPYTDSCFPPCSSKNDNRNLNVVLMSASYLSGRMFKTPFCVVSLLCSPSQPSKVSVKFIERLPLRKVEKDLLDITAGSLNGGESLLVAL